MAAVVKNTRRFRSHKQEHIRINWQEQKQHRMEQTSYIVNLSTKTLTPPQLAVLRKGLGFVPNSTSEPDFTAGTNKLTRILRLNHFFKDGDQQPLTAKLPPFRKVSTWQPPPADQATEAFLKELPDKLQRMERRPFKHNMRKSEKIALRELQKDTSLTIKKADKGSCVVIEDTDQYIKDGLSHLQDQRTYAKISEDPTEELAKATNKYVATIASKGYLNKNMEVYLTHKKPQDVRTQLMYFIKKLHKGPHEVRPIVSGINGPTERMSAFIDYFIQPLASSVPSYIQDSADLIRKLENLPPLPPDVILASVDVTGLYTNIPQDEGICSVLKHLYHQDCEEEPPFPETVAKEMMKIVLGENYFEFNGDCYHQIRGTAMGTKMAPSYAILFMAELESQLLKEEPTQPLLFLRYIDDILLLWTGSKHSLEEMLARFNKAHHSIKFTHQISSEKVIFLDLEIYKGQDFCNTGKLDTKPHYKDTNRFQYLQYNSSHPRSTFRGIVKAEMIRALRASSNETDFQNSTTMLGSRFRARGYPPRLITEIKALVPFSARCDALKKKEQTCSNDRPPFVSTHSDQIPKAELTKALAPPDGIQQPLMAFKKGRDIAQKLVKARIKESVRPSRSTTTMILRHAPSFKTHSKPCGTPMCGCCRLMSGLEVVYSKKGTPHKTPEGTTCNSAGIIYLMHCTLCEHRARYVGQTKRRLKERINGHRRDCASKNMPLYRHLRRANHSFETVKVTVLQQISHPTEDALLKAEEMWVRELETRIPHGLNSKFPTWKEATKA